MKLSLFVIALLCLLSFAWAGDDYYEILGIGRDADNREIRKAFKKLALKYHPDKNKDEGSQEMFLKINKAYETLKDEEKRKRYDRFGEEDEEQKGSQGFSGNYQSWNYYHDDFGLYDDDPEIITLDYHDFRRSVSDSYNTWFINFYSPQCGHCHEIAPTWRKLAKMLNGIVRIGAVNCQDDFMLCRQQNIFSYPSLVLFGPQGTMRFQGARELNEMVDFVTKAIPDHTQRLRTANFDKIVFDEDNTSPWVIMFCVHDDFRCPEEQHRHLLATFFSTGRLVNLGFMDCNANKKLCKEFTNEEYGTYYFASRNAIKKRNGKRLQQTEFRDLAQEILDTLPGVKVLDEEKYSNIRLKLEDDRGPSWLVHFVFGSDGVSTDEKKIPASLSGINFGRIDCNEQPKTCKELKISKPSYVCFKIGGGYEIYFGRENPLDVAEFARNSAMARSMKTLVTSDFPKIMRQRAVFIDFFAPWCPPCLNLLPEYRKAAQMVGGSVVFGTVDCTTQPKICDQHNIRSYPTTVFFNNSKPHYYQGVHSAESLADFVREILRPSVIELDHRSFHKMVMRKPENEMWLIDFYAPWCGPCMQLSPQWTKLAKLMKKIPEVKVAKVDCTVEERLCHEQVVRSYPSIRMYPMNDGNMGKYFVYTGFQRDAYSLREWVMESLPTFVENLTPYSFVQRVQRASRPAIIDFYTPWCGHCQHFAPIFDDIALEIRDRVLAGKVDCQRFPSFCHDQGIRAYPTVKFYPGETDMGQEIPTREPEEVIRFIEGRLELATRKRRLRDEL